MIPNQAQSASHSRLATLREELNQLKTPSYPDELATVLTGWGAKTIPVIREDFAGQLEAFEGLLAKGYTSHLQIAKMTYASVSTFHSAWEKDNEDAVKKQHTILTFIDGLL